MTIMKKIGIFLGLLLLILVAFGLYLNRGLPHKIMPAELNCLSIEDGYFTDFDTLPTNIFGIGLSYSGHINETANDFDPQGDPPVFLKSTSSLTKNRSKVKIPDHQTMLEAAEQLEPGISRRVNEQFPSLPALLDYEVELGFVLLEDIPGKNLTNEEYAPKIGFFIANDLSARSVGVLGEGLPNRYDYWGVSKSFLGFTPISEKLWSPNEFQANSIPCIMLETQVNGEIRQHQMTSDMIYSPLQMLQAIHRKYPNRPLLKGDLVLTGTPGGVVMSAPRWLVRLAGILGMDRFKKLANLTSNESDISKFLQVGDRVLVNGKGLGNVEVEIVE